MDMREAAASAPTGDFWDAMGVRAIGYLESPSLMSLKSAAITSDECVHGGDLFLRFLSTAPQVAAPGSRHMAPCTRRPPLSYAGSGTR